MKYPLTGAILLPSFFFGFGNFFFFGFGNTDENTASSPVFAPYQQLVSAFKHLTQQFFETADDGTKQQFAAEYLATIALSFPSAIDSA